VLPGHLDFHDSFGRGASVLVAAQSSFALLSRSFSTVCWRCWHFGPFAASIAGGVTIHFATLRLNDNSCALRGAKFCTGASFERKAILRKPQVSLNDTSNDLLPGLNGDEDRSSLNYQIVAQSADEVQEVQNAPAFSMGPYLISSGQTKLLTTISIYSQRGEDCEQLRLLFMNRTAMRIWREMGQRPKVIGTQHRPPSTALLTFGVPFSE